MCRDSSPATTSSTVQTQTSTTLPADVQAASSTQATTSSMPPAATETTARPEATSTSTTSSTAAAPAGTFIAKVADVPSGSSQDFTYKGKRAILVNFDGQFYAYVNICTHNNICATKYEGDILQCPCHGAQFRPDTGDVMRGPAQRPLTTIDVEVSGDGIYSK